MPTRNRSAGGWAVLGLAWGLLACAEAPPSLDAGAGKPRGACANGCPVGASCLRGTCVSPSCAAEVCLATQVCLDNQCVEAACVGVACPGTVCVQGQCLPRSCGETACEPDQVCVDGACEDAACVGVACAAGTLCVDGNCLPTSCGGKTCPPGQVCDGNACAEASCVGVACPAASRCVAGTCEPCSADEYADAGRCVPRQPAGAPCGGKEACKSGQCVDGTCCTTACDGPCERCNAPGKSGTCSPVAFGSPCDGGVCNGAACVAASGAPCSADPDCGDGESCRSGTCLPPASNGLSCLAPSQCASGHCVDGVCCNAECGGGSCGACTVARGAPQDGTCAPLPANTVCRPSAGGCDLEERCTGTQVECPEDELRPDGEACGAPDAGPWSACLGFADVCATEGSRSRTLTDFACNTGTCVPSSTQEEQPCTRTTDGTTCAPPEAGTWSSCGDFVDAQGNPSPVCGESGTQSRDETTWTCESGTCSAVTVLARKGCARSTAGTVCDDPLYDVCYFPPGSLVAVGYEWTYECSAGACKGTPALILCTW